MHLCTFCSILFLNAADEVRAKSRALERSQLKLHSAQEDIADLQTEFELERQDYLNTIRNQVWNCCVHSYASMCSDSMLS